MKKANKQIRAINRDGTFNVQKIKQYRFLTDTYHWLVSLPFYYLIILISVFYFSINALFASIYFLLGPDSLLGLSGNQKNGFDFWLTSFFFSIQTFGTIGYGAVSPANLMSHIVVTLESLTSFISMALCTGLIFSRFSLPRAKVLFSKVAIVHTIDGIPSFMVRIANTRQNEIIEAQVQLTLLHTVKTQEGETYREFVDLKLERSNSPLFALSWIISHPIDSSSPLFGKSLEELKTEEAEFILTFRGIDSTLSNTIHTRISYIPDEIKWNHRFVDIMSRTADHKIAINLKNLHATESL